MVIEGIVLGHKISATGLEVGQAKIYVIKTLMPPTTVKGIKSYLGHAGFYMRFIKEISKIARPLCRLLEKDTKFEFDEACKSAIEEKKARLVRNITTQKILQSGFYWQKLFKDSSKWAKHCDKCQRMGNINRRNEMPMQGILVVQTFDV